MEYERDYIILLKQLEAMENETVRFYASLMALAPEKDIPKILELVADESDHMAVVCDLLLEAVSGQSADQEQLVWGVD